MTDEQLSAEEEAELAGFSARLQTFLTNESLESVILRCDPLLMALIMSIVQYARSDLAANERERLCNLLPELTTLTARYPRVA